MGEDKQKYGEVAEQIYNLVDNDKDKINAFLTAISSTEDKEKGEIQRWFDNYVKPDELDDLLCKGQSRSGLVRWLSDERNNDYIDTYLNCIDASIAADAPSYSRDVSSMMRDIEDEDEELYNNTDGTKAEDVSFSSSNVDDQDELDLAFAALDSDDPINVTFEIVDGSDDGSDEGEEIKVKEKLVKEKKNGRKKIHLDHTINRVVKKIDDEEVTDRSHHEKYYVAKREQLGGPDNLDKLEDELDKQMISYYDFPHVSIKMYEHNEVKMNRIFKKLGFDFRCKDIAKYTHNWNAK